MIPRPTEDLLVLTKTYPHPSTKYRETTCVAAVNSRGQMRRLFPVPFRLLAGPKQFKKWEWIRAKISRAQDDHRPESYKIDVDSVVRSGTSISTRGGWAERRRRIKSHIVDTFSALEARRQATGETLGYIRPSRLLELEITPVRNPDWTANERANLQREGLFDSEAVRTRPVLRKLPFEFHYRYECTTNQGAETCRHMLTDWEVGALFWHCYRDYGRKWETAFRERLEVQFAKKDLLLLMGTVHRFPDQWLIVGLVYPPKQAQVGSEQLVLEMP